MLFKWLWRYSRGSDEVWQKMLDVIYGEKEGWRQSSAQLKHYGGIWKKISEGWDEFLQHTKLEVGNGARIKFWRDIWNGDECFKNRFPDLFSCALNKDGHIADFDPTSGWHITFRRNLNDWELNSFFQLLQQLST